MANHGKRRKPNSNKANKAETNAGSQTEYDQYDEYDDMSEDTASFEPQESITEADGYQFNTDWETWEEEDTQEDYGEEYTEDSYEEESYDEESYDEYGVDELSSEPPTRNATVHCDNCGEDYSDTYKRCPFCDERRNSYSPNKTRSTGAGMDPRHFLGFSISMALIFSAGFIVVQEVLPLLFSSNTSNTGSTDNSQGVTEGFDSSIPGAEVFDPTQPPVGSETPDTEIPEGESPDTDIPDEYQVDDIPPALDLEEAPNENGTVVLSATDVSLKGDESFTLSVTSGGTATWTSSHPEIASVDSKGKVTNLNTQGSSKTVEITATVNGSTSKCIVRCASGVGAGSSSSSTTTTTGGLGTGSATIANASGGVRIRAGAGTDHAVLATGSNGSAIQVLGAAEGGWYQIQFTGSNGKEVGYILGDYIAMN